MNSMYDILNKMALLESRDTVAEKIEPPIKTDPSERGKYKGKDIGDLKAMKKANLDKTEKYRERGEKVPDELKAKTAELNFAIRAKQAGGGKWGKIREDEVDEGNEFTAARMAAIRAGKPTFSVAGKTYKVSGDTADERRQMKMDESVIEEGFAEFFDKKQMYKQIGADVEGRSDDYVVTFRDGTRKRYQEIDGRRRVTSLEPVDRNDAVDDAGEVVKRGRGRPKGTGRKMGARGQTRVAEDELEEDYDKDEYDEEGEMAKSQARTIEDAAKELQSILDDDENLPEWVQKKITLALEYIDTARDYMKANPDEEEIDVEVTGDEEIMAEKAVSKAQRAAAGIAYAAKKGDIPKSELRGASKEMAKMPAGELEKFAKTKEKGLPEKKKEESVEETTVAGSVATSSAPAKKSKSGVQFGKGIYEAQLEESYQQRLNTMLTEGMSVNMSMNADGGKSMTVTADEQDAVKLAQILHLAGLGSSDGYQDACPTCGQSSCAGHDLEEADLANAPDPVYGSTEMINDQGEDLHKRKSTGQTTIPVIASQAARQDSVARVYEEVKAEAEDRLWQLYQGRES